MKEVEENHKKGSKEPYPKSVFFIISNEFCERFSFYGMRTVLVIFLTQVLLYSGNEATMIFHIFAMGCYFTPILGAIIADSWLGKFKTIFYISIIYAIGNALISVGSVPHPVDTMKILSLLGLGFIAVGTGGIKPCVAAFGGDQFGPGQEKQLKQFFSFFYLSINLGSAVSTFLTPILRKNVKCFGQDTCFPLAFGVPAALMLISLVIFLIGKPLYKIRPPQGNVLPKFFKCIFHAISRRLSAKEKKRKHWLHYADDKYDMSFIENVKTVLHILLLYLPLPIFWALFDQQGSKWTLQAVDMDGRIGGYTVQPDQMQTWNPVLVILCIPLFDFAIYPLLSKCNILTRPLQRITVGGILAALSFVLAALLQLSVEKTLPGIIPVGHSQTMIINNSPCPININGDIEKTLGSFQETMLPDMKLRGNQLWNVIPKDCGDLKSAPYNFTSHHSFQTLMITTSPKGLEFVVAQGYKKKIETGEAKITIFYNIPNLNMSADGSVFWLEEKSDSTSFALSPEYNTSEIGTTLSVDVEPKTYKICFRVKDRTQSLCTKKFSIGPGGVYVQSLFYDPQNMTDVHLQSYTIVEPNTIHLLYQAPQYVLITIGEIMFSITGLEFSYSQAPKSMKSVLQAAWLLTVAIGDLIVVIVSKSSFFKLQSNEFFMYAALMGVDMLLFAVIATFYKYVDTSSSEEESDVDENEKTEQPKLNKENTVTDHVEDTKF